MFLQKLKVNFQLSYDQLNINQHHCKQHLHSLIRAALSFYLFLLLFIVYYVIICVFYSL